MPNNLPETEPLKGLLEGLRDARSHQETSRSFIPEVEIHCQCGQKFKGDKAFSAEVRHYKHAETASVDDVLASLERKIEEARLEEAHDWDNFGGSDEWRAQRIADLERKIQP